MDQQQISAKAGPSKRAASLIEVDENEDEDMKKVELMSVKGKGKQCAAARKLAGKSAIQKA